MEHIAKRALEGAAGETTIRLHVADRRLDCAASTPERWGHPPHQFSFQAKEGAIIR